MMPQETKAEQARRIINKRQPLGLFYLHNDVLDVWVAIDNSNGKALTEQFRTKQAAIDWLNDNLR